MHSEIFGFRVNLIYIAVVVALYDLVHILYELKERFDLFWLYEDFNDGCLSDLFQTHCIFIYTEVSIYVLDFIFTGFLIYGSSSLKTIPVLAWIVLSAYHLIDFLIIFTPVFGNSYAFHYMSIQMWLDLSFSMLGFFYVVYFYKKLVEVKQGAVEREKLTNVDELNLTGVDLEAY